MIISCLQEFYKRLTDEQKACLREADRERLERLCAKRASQFVYALEEGTKQAWLASLRKRLRRLHQHASLQSSAGSALIERLLLEPYQIEGEEQRVVLKPAKEISADSLQSPPDGFSLAWQAEKSLQHTEII